MTVALENAPTRYIQVEGVKYAYRLFGAGSGTPLVFLQHFTGTMDAWDPAVVNALAQNRQVIIFNNAGVGTSSGSTPDNIEQMTVDAENFLAALGLTEVDLLGFSLGGFIAQLMAVRTKIIVRKLILAGTAPKSGEEHLLQVVGDAFARNAPDVRLPLFFTQTENGQSKAREFVARASVRTDNRDPDNGEAVSNPQAAAIIGWCAEPDDGHQSLKAIKQPTLIVHGSDDTMFPSDNAYLMFKQMSDATLIIYPDSAHGALFQEPDIFVAHVNTFLGV